MTQSKLELMNVGFWITPASEEELYELVTGLQSPEAIHAMMFTWNYMVKLLEEKQDDPANAEG